MARCHSCCTVDISSTTTSDKTMKKLTTAAFDMAGQENCDGEEYDMIQALAERVEQLENPLWLILTAMSSGDCADDELPQLVKDKCGDLFRGEPYTNPHSHYIAKLQQQLATTNRLVDADTEHMEKLEKRLELIRELKYANMSGFIEDVIDGKDVENVNLGSQTMRKYLDGIKENGR